MVETLVTSLSLGFLSAATPCLLPLYPGFLAYLSGQAAAHGTGRSRYALGLFVLAGVLLMMVLLGLVIALLSVSVGQALTVLIPVSDLLIFALGILLLLDHNPFNRLPQIRFPLLSNPLANAFLYGLLYGPLALPCSGPLVVGIFALSLNAAEVLNKLLVFLFFGLGFGLPLLVLSFAAGASQRWVTQQFARHTRLINIASGLLLIGIAVLDAWSNWEMIRAFLGIG